MRKLFLLFVAFVATTSLWAQRFQVGDLYYNITSSSASYAVEVSNAVRSITSAIIPETVTYNGTTYSVTSIGEDAFSFCTSLTSVTIPNSVTIIGNFTFEFCSSLTSITIPNSVTSIGNQAFQYCEALTSVTIGESVTSIGHMAFYACFSLTSVTIGESVTTIGEAAFQSCSFTSITIPNSVTTIGNYAFNDCSSLTSITIPNSVTDLGNSAFYGCSSLTSVTIGESVTTIGERAFYGCSSLTSVTIGESVTTIGECAFQSCSSLNSVTIPNSVTDLGNSAFYGCSSLTSITLPNSVTTIEWCTFQDCSSLTSVTIGESVTTIGERAFYGCSSLTSITLPNSVTTIEWGNFQDCSSLTSVTLTAHSMEEFCKGQGNSLLYLANVYCNRQIQIDGKDVIEITIPNTVTSIGKQAFYHCSSLTSVTIPNSVTSIGDHAFYSCDSLTSVTCEATTPPAIGSSAFDWEIPVYVPCGCVEAYKTASGWESVNIQDPLAEYSINLTINDSNMGTAQVDKNTACGNQISAIANYGYHFVRWSDGNTDNPRSLELTQDTVLTAEFAQTYSGQCGDHLYWEFANNTLTITGTGAMYDERPWSLLVDQIQKIALPIGITHIGNDAFQDCIGLRDIDLPYTLETIGDYSFNGCRKLITINCYPLLPPKAESTSFSNYSANLYAPCDNLDEYKYDMVFGQFKYFECIGSESVSTNGTVVTPGSTDVTITWPTEENADTYTIVIMKGDVIFCRLIFNKEGQLLNIAFAPSRDGKNHPAQYAAQTANGLRFTVTGLEEKTKYGYDVSAQDEGDNTLSSYTGEFTTMGGTAVEDILQNTTNIQKILRNGHLLIIRDGVEYNAMGQEL